MFFFLFTNVTLAESIKDFSVNIKINSDASIDVEENILYDSGMSDRHGIIRNIRTLSAQGETMDISDIKVSTADTEEYPFKKTTSDKEINLKIGYPQLTFKGEKEYKISYKVKYAISYFKDFDELYWNVTGNEWTFPIEKSSVKIISPLGVGFIKKASYCGPYGSSLPCQELGTDTFYHNGVLNPGSGMTVAVGFSKGVVDEPLWIEKFWYKVRNLWSILVAFLISLFWHRNKIKGIIKKYLYYKKNPVVVQYDSGGFSPLESSLFLNGIYTDKALIATIISLAISGYIKIENKDGEFIFKKNKEIDSLLKDEEKKILELISDKSELSIKSSVSKGLNIDQALSFVTKSLVVRDYINEAGLKTRESDINPFGILFISIFLAINPGIFFFFLFYDYLGWEFVSSLIFSYLSIFTGVLYCLLKNLRSDSLLTAKGFDAQRYILGLKKYIEVAEKDRINFHNEEAKTPVLFEKLLPYAVLFGLEERWANEFTNLTVYNPGWINDVGQLSTKDLVRSLSGINSLRISSLKYEEPMRRSSGGSSFHSSGSSGHGSSGGGGGGGGGSSW